MYYSLALAASGVPFCTTLSVSSLPVVGVVAAGSYLAAAAGNAVLLRITWRHHHTKAQKDDVSDARFVYAIRNALVLNGNSTLCAFVCFDV